MSSDNVLDLSSPATLSPSGQMMSSRAGRGIDDIPSPYTHVDNRQQLNPRSTIENRQRFLASQRPGSGKPVLSRADHSVIQVEPISPPSSPPSPDCTESHHSGTPQQHVTSSTPLRHPVGMTTVVDDRDVYDVDKEEREGGSDDQHLANAGREYLLELLEMERRGVQDENAAILKQAAFENYIEMIQKANLKKRRQMALANQHQRPRMVGVAGDVTRQTKGVVSTLTPPTEPQEPITVPRESPNPGVNPGVGRIPPLESLLARRQNMEQYKGPPAKRRLEDIAVDPACGNRAIGQPPSLISSSASVIKHADQVGIVRRLDESNVHHQQDQGNMMKRHCLEQPGQQGLDTKHQDVMGRSMDQSAVLGRYLGQEMRRHQDQSGMMDPRHVVDQRLMAARQLDPSAVAKLYGQLNASTMNQDSRQFYGDSGLKQCNDVTSGNAGPQQQSPNSRGALPYSPSLQQSPNAEELRRALEARWSSMSPGGMGGYARSEERSSSVSSGRGGGGGGPGGGGGGVDKDEAYWERRRKNNEAAKRSRDTRRAKEEQIANRASLLAEENLQLRAQIAILKTETANLHLMLYNRI